MKNYNLKFKIIFTVLILFGIFGAAKFSQAATINAASCLQPTIQGILNNASFVSGDVLQMPTCSETWTAAVTVPVGKNITIKGNGSTNTIITYTGTAIGLGTTASRVTAMGFVTTATSVSGITAQGHGWRVDHCRFDNNTNTSTFVYPGGTTGVVFPSGLIDNNIVNNGRITVTENTSVSRKHTRWNTPITFGNDEVVYIEDNVFTRTDNYEGNFADANGGMRYVVRYNTITNTGDHAQNLYAHGIRAVDRGTRSWEVYGNLWDTTSPLAAVIWMKSGTGFIFYNSLTGYSEDNVVRLEAQRAGSTYGDPADNDTLLGRCDGDNICDGNIDANGWPCRDNIGVGKDAYLYSTAPYPSQEIQPAYVWTVLNDGVYKNVVGVPSSGWVGADKAYYQTVASFNGTSGVGCGTLASRPATCTMGVGYWATNQSCSDISTMVGDINTYPTRATISGTLYKCTATNTWTAYYTPYTYPHPLRVSGVFADSPTVPDTVPPAPPSGVVVQ